MWTAQKKKTNKKRHYYFRLGWHPLGLQLYNMLCIIGNGLTSNTVVTLTQDTDFFEAGDQISKLSVSSI